MQIYRILLYLIFSLLASPLTKAGDVIQTEPATYGDAEVDIIKTTVNDDILTMQLAFRNKGGEPFNISCLLSDVYFIDGKEKKKYHVIQDSRGDYLAAPVFTNRMNLELTSGGRIIVWFKFPSPPITTTKISLFVPGILPFEDIPISQ
jgi:hypothetical protein